MSDSDLVEIAKQTGEFKKHYGKYWGGFIQLRLANKASGRRPFLWGWLVSIGTVLGGLLVRYALPHLGR
ncbi:hypothetical protein [Bradyrhizobium sp. LTSP849]|uniref:hypothetical protein n=1 Tax=Bradyrhizobium sp. LTSP849 TaxID=1615890 RepID=UPI000A904A1B|nr:hypothetical protein [Bradyrhizobium sp. LTSP849]